MKLKLKAIILALVLGAVIGAGGANVARAQTPVKSNTTQTSISKSEEEKRKVQERYARALQYYQRTVTLMEETNKLMEKVEANPEQFYIEDVALEMLEMGRVAFKGTNDHVFKQYEDIIGKFIELEALERKYDKMDRDKYAPGAQDIVRRGLQLQKDIKKCGCGELKDVLPKLYDYYELAKDRAQVGIGIFEDILKKFEQ
jgi:hypothetical protein